MCVWRLIPCSSRGGARGRWYKFNDNVVEEFDMNDETLEYECFGGEYRPKVYDQCKSPTRDAQTLYIKIYIYRYIFIYVFMYFSGMIYRQFNKCSFIKWRLVTFVVIIVSFW